MQLANHEKKVGQRDTNGWKNSMGDSMFAETMAESLKLN
jgi:hypothetical protein